ncbi:MAG: M28 family peptidase [Gammaproteobacteria bacterium]|nr:M28 family peptidase [Gammaproteobacteria bacterium]
MKIMKASLLISTLLLAAPALAEDVDLAVVHRIKQEAFLNSKVMDYMHLIADENGPRMSGSPAYRRAAEAAVAAFKAAGIEKAEIEPSGHFGRGWDWTRVAVQMKTPQRTTLSAYPADWSPGTDGPVSGDVVFAPVWEHPDDTPTNGDIEKLAHQIEAWKDKYRGQLRGKVVMLDHPNPWELPEEPEKFRISDEDLAAGKVTDYDGDIDPGPVPTLEWPLVAYPVDKDKRSRIWDVMPLEFAADRWVLQVKIRNRISVFLREEGAVAILLTGEGPRASVIFNSDFGSYFDDDPIPPPTVALMPEHYNRIYRLLKREVPVEVEVDVDAEFYPNQQGLNIIAEFPGRSRKGEVVMLGGHFDSWHGATGATDNASGSAVTMEVMRILKELDLPMRRTVRAGLWGEEEQCLCGSRRYVARHFADPVTMKLKPGHKKLSVYFNLDSGSGKIRGIYLQQNDMARPIIEAWMAPFADLGVGNAIIVNTTGTDHLSFNAVGLPGFSFVQDPLDYDLNTHHSNADHVDHVLPGDLMQAAAVMATAVYHAANREEMMPRKPLPKALPPKNELPEILK